MDFVKATVLIDGSDHTLKNVSKQFRRLERLDLSLVHGEILVAERVPQEISDIFLLEQVVLAAITIEAVFLQSHNAAEL